MTSNQPELSELISLTQASMLYGLSTGHLRLLIGRGELWGIKLGRNWLTTARALENYIQQGHKPGPKPKKP